MRLTRTVLEFIAWSLIIAAIVLALRDATLGESILGFVAAAVGGGLCGVLWHLIVSDQPDGEPK